MAASTPRSYRARSIWRASCYEIVAEDGGGRGGRFPIDHLRRTHPLILDAETASAADRHWAVYGHARHDPIADRQQFRFWMHDENVARIADRGVHSDHYLRGSLVYESRQIYYGSGFHFQGSALSRGPWISFRIRLPDDALHHSDHVAQWYWSFCSRRLQQ